VVYCREREWRQELITLFKLYMTGGGGVIYQKLELVTLASAYLGTKYPNTL